MDHVGKRRDSEGKEKELLRVMGMNIIIIHSLCINKLSKTKEKTKDNFMGARGVFNKVLEGRVSIQFIHIVSSF